MDPFITPLHFFATANLLKGVRRRREKRRRKNSGVEELGQKAIVFFFFFLYKFLHGPNWPGNK